MKRYIIILIIFASLFTGCESFLEPAPDSLIVPENMNDPELLLRGAYENLRSGNDSWKISTNLFLNYGNDELVRNALKGTSGNFWDLTTFGYNTSNSEIKTVWTYLWSGVNASNHAVIAAQNVGNIQVEAEARFIRSFYYYTLTLYLVVSH
jgi:hypothetical protein